jgi:hypothetical protein
MNPLIIIFFSVLAIQSFGQALTWEGEDLENKFYYPSKKVIKDNGVRFKIDSNIYQLPGGYWVEAFDKQGRIIGSFSHSVDSFSNPYKYIEKGDTLLRVRLRDGDATIYMIERFIYNIKAQILQFDRFHDDFLSEGTLQLYRTLFFYENDKVAAKLMYSLETKGKLTEDYTIETNSMKLWSVKQYTYKRTKLHSLMIVQEKAGKPDFRDIDTFMYDNKQRLVKHTNFAKSAYFLHNSVVNDVKTIESYEYKNDSVFIQSYTTNSLNSQEQSDIDYKIRIFNKEGLEIKNYHGYKKEKIELYDRMRYVYY